MSGNIFNIQEDYLKLMAEIETNDGVLDKEQEYKLKVNEEELEAKLKAYANIIKLKQGDIQLCKDEIDRLTTIKKSRESLIERLKDVIKQAVNLYGIEGKTGNRRLDFDTIKFYTTVRDSLIIPEDFNNTDYIDDLTTVQIPSNYNKQFTDELVELLDKYSGIIYKTDVKIDKDTIKSTIESGEEVEGCSIIKKDSVTIK